MPLAAVLLAINAACIIHAAKTGRFWPWAYVILMLPGIGAVAYFAIELMPEWLGSPGGQRARHGLLKRLNPQKRYRRLVDELAAIDTIANRVALGEECLALGKFAEAKEHYANVLMRPLGDEPIFALGKARAEFGLGQPQDAAATLEWLRERWPDYQSADGHLLYARALEGSGRANEALDEYEALSRYYPGAEARVRYALLLDKVGQPAACKALLIEVLTQLKRAPKFARKSQAEWITTAERALRV